MQDAYDDVCEMISELCDETMKKIAEELEINTLCSLLKIADVDDEAMKFFTTLIDKGCPPKAIIATLLELGKEKNDEDRNNRENDDNIPAADVRENVRGRWIKRDSWSSGFGMGETYGYWWACSNCNNEVKSGYGGCDYNYCPTCGADMRGE